MSIDDQADLDIKAMLHHDDQHEKKCKEAETVKEEFPDKVETDDEADIALKRQKEMETKLERSQTQKDKDNAELNGTCGDEVLWKAISNSRDETDELLDRNDE